MAAFRHIDDYGTVFYVEMNPDLTLVVQVDGDRSRGVVYNIDGDAFAQWMTDESKGRL